MLSNIVNSVICVITGSAMIDFSLVVGHIFLLLFMPSDFFYWMPYIVIFTLSYAGYFCILVNTLIIVLHAVK